MIVKSWKKTFSNEIYSRIFIYCRDTFINIHKNYIFLIYFISSELRNDKLLNLNRWSFIYNKKKKIFKAAVYRATKILF